MDLTRKIHDRMLKDHLLFVYRGEITDRNSLSLLTLLENEMKDDSFGIVGRKRLFMFALESLQNIAKHGDHNRHRNMSLVVYSRTNDGYTITTGNTLDRDNISDLRQKLERVNNLNPDELKVLYKNILSKSGFSHKGGAGLGLIEMAVKTGNKLDFDFSPVNGAFSYFILRKTVDSMGIGIHSAESDTLFDPASVKQLEKLMSENMIHMIWSGHLTSSIGEEVLSLTESKFADEDIDSGLRRRIFSIMVEILENVSKYNPGREAEEKFGKPVAIVRLDNDKFLLTTGNLILNSRIDELKGKLDTVNSLDSNGLKQLFYKSLSGQTIETDSTGNMGLIAVARKSGSKLNYQFEKVNETYSFYMLTVRVEDTCD